MEDIKNKDTVSTEEEGDDSSEQVQPCSASKIDRQTSYTKKDTIEVDVVQDGGLKNQRTDGVNCIQEAENEKDEKKANEVQQDDNKKERDHKNLGEDTSRMSGNDKDKSEIKSKDTAEEEDDQRDQGKNIKVENTVDFEDSVSEGPSIDIKGNKTVDEGSDKTDGSIRGSQTEEEPGQAIAAFPPAEYNQQNGHMSNTKVILKISNIRSHQKNIDPFTKMIDSLPSEVVKKSIGQSSIFGRGEKVDVYLHDLLSSRRHIKLDVVKDRRGFLVEVMNISETKAIRLNGAREVRPNETVILENNDQLTIGCFTFLTEIAQGDQRSTQYELKFVNIFNTSSHISHPTENPVLYARQNSPQVQQQQYAYNQPHARPEMYPMRMQGHYPYYMPEMPPPGYVQDPYAQYQMQPMPVPPMPSMGPMPGYQMPQQQLPQPRQQHNPYYSMLNQQMANMSLQNRARMPTEHDDRFGTQVVEHSMEK